MENRRQLAMQRKADEEKARAQEEERKIKEEAERRGSRSPTYHVSKVPQIQTNVSIPVEPLQSPRPASSARQAAQLV